MNESELRLPDDSPDPELARVLRPVLAPPHEDYWSALERGILARIAEERAAWWSVFADWTRPAILAAAVALVAATVLLSKSNSADAAIAYGAMSEEQQAVVGSGTATASDPAATVHMLLDH